MQTGCHSTQGTERRIKHRTLEANTSLCYSAATDGGTKQNLLLKNLHTTA